MNNFSFLPCKKFYDYLLYFLPIYTYSRFRSDSRSMSLSNTSTSDFCNIFKTLPLHSSATCISSSLTSTLSIWIHRRRPYCSRSSVFCSRKLQRAWFTFRLPSNWSSHCSRLFILWSWSSNFLIILCSSFLTAVLIAVSISSYLAKGSKSSLKYVFTSSFSDTIVAAFLAWDLVVGNH